MQFDIIADGSSDAFDNNLPNTPKYVYLFFYFSVNIVFTVHLCIFPKKSLKTYTVLILYCFSCTVFSLKSTNSRTLSINIIQSGLSVCGSLSLSPAPRGFESQPNVHKGRSFG